MPVQMGYGPSEPLDSRAKKILMRFLRDSAVHSLKPIMTNAMHYPDHTILLSLEVAQGEGEVLAVADPPVSDQVNRILIAVRPEDARTLVRLLQKHMGTQNDPSEDADSERQPS